MRSKTGLAWPSVAIIIAPTAMASSTNAAAPGDACALLSSEQVGAALGVPVGAGTYVTPTFTKTCTWTATTSGGGTVTLNLQSLDQYGSGKKLASVGKSVSANVISGIGDEAYYFGTDKLVSLFVKRGGNAFKVAVYAHGMPADKRQVVERTLALQVASQL